MKMRLLFILLGISCGLSAEKVVISNQSELPCKIFLPGTRVSDVVTVQPLEESPVLAADFDYLGDDNIIYLSSGVVGLKGVRVISGYRDDLVVTRTVVFDYNTNPATRVVKEVRYDNIHIIISPDGSIAVNDGTKIVKSLSSAQKA